ncbi:AsmA family protein [Marinomonas mediterranea]|uniref:AsmA family protein n=1 Tax=Marinomonas mediterranea (strain ATCC 700492 / JCM 21426 / NBRC 103028 / MMB-1) TaxID=717774 RepID=F2K135_MARM1|nr:AsmA family protein [Marinomonas mediterranea]ADZ89885.1 AsmA family protein [Marinomonas mediterranea MMB-1]WCN16103.1 AsmA family protein [Marinomonas mediterranea MMB-1]
MVWVKRLLFVLVFLLALVLGGIGYVLIFVDPNDFKKELISLADKHANIDLKIDGDISWSFFPWLGVELNDIGVAAKGESTLAKFEEAEFRLAVLPLLQQKIEVDTVRLIGLKADLVMDEEGNGNWQLGSKTDSQKQASNQSSIASSTASMPSETDAVTPNAAKAAQTSSAYTIPDINIEKIELVDAQVRFVDKQRGMDLLAMFNTNLSNVRWGEAWPLEFDIKLEGILPKEANGEQQSIGHTMSLGADLTVFPEHQRLALSDLIVKTRTEAAMLPISPLLANAQIRQLELDLPQENLIIDGLSLDSLGVSFESQIKVFELLSKPQFSLAANVTEFSPRELLNKLALPLPEMADETTLSALQLTLSLEGDANAVKVQPISIRLDETQLEANASVKFTPLSWNVSVAGKTLDLDRYLPPNVEGDNKTEADSTASAEASGEEVQESDLIPVELLRTLNGTVDFTFENLKAKNLSIDKISATSVQSNGLVTLKPLFVGLYDGSAHLNATLDARSDTPKISISPNIEHVQIYPLLNDFMELDKVKGTTFVSGDLHTSGNRISELMNQLNGDLLVEVKDGALVGMNLTKSVCEGIASTRSGKDVNQTAFGEDTPFESLTFPARIVNGVVSTPDLKIKAVGIQVTGDGEVSLPEQNIHYQADVSIVGSDVDQACQIKRVYRSLAFPIVCKGAFDSDPATLCRPDIKGFGRLFEKVAKAELDAKLAAEKARAKEKLAAEKARAKAKLDAEKAKAKAELEAKLVEAKRKAEEKKKAKEEELKQKLKNELKDGLKSLF